MKPKTRAVTVKFEMQFYQRIAGLADKMGVSVADIVRLAVGNGFARLESGCKNIIVNLKS